MKWSRRRLAALLCAVMTFNITTAYGDVGFVRTLADSPEKTAIETATDSDAEKENTEDGNIKPPVIVIDTDEDDATASDAAEYPAFYWEEDFGGVAVTLSAQEGVLPEGTYAEIEELDLQETATASDAGRIRFLFDITLFDENGSELSEEWQENGKVQVSFTGTRIEEAKEQADSAKIIHVDEDGSEDVVKNLSMSGANLRREGVSFSAEHFSVYGVEFLADLVTAEWGTWDEDTKTLTVTAEDIGAIQNEISQYKGLAEKLIIDTQGDIPDRAFEDFENVSEIRIAAAGDIGEMAFAGCGNGGQIIRNIFIEQCGNIGDSAFYRLNGAGGIVEIKTCGNIEKNAFNYAKISDSVTIEKCNDIKTGAFTSSNVGTPTVTSLEIGTCGAVGKEAFKGLSGLEQAKIKTISGEIEDLFSEIGTLESVKIENCGNIPSGAFEYCESLKEIIIGKCGNIGKHVFGWCKNVESLTITECGDISQEAFLGMPNLKTVTIDSCGEIGSYAFSSFMSSTGREWCEALESVKIGSCTKIGSNAFRVLKNLNNISIGSCQSIGESAFSGVGNEEKPIEILSLDGVVIEENAFSNIYINNLVLKNIDSIGAQAFVSADIHNITLSTVEKIGSEAFAYLTGLETLTIEKMDEISESAFQVSDDGVCAVETIVLREIEWIGDYAFKNFNNLKTVIIEGDCGYVGAHAFSGCANLKTINIPDDTKMGYSDSFVQIENIKARVTAILKGAFQLAEKIPDLEKILPDGWTSAKIGKQNSAEKIGDTQLTKEAKWSDGEATIADVKLKAYYAVEQQMDFIFVADCSNSMSGFGSGEAMNSNFYNMQSKMMDVADELLDAAQKLDTRIAFSTFGEDESSLSSFFGKGETAQAKDYIWKEIVNYHSNTNYSNGLTGALELVKENRAAGRNTTVVFISDGQPYYDGVTIPDSYFGVEESEAIRGEGAQILAVLQQVPDSALAESMENMKKLTPESKIFASTDLAGFSTAINDAIEFAYSSYVLTDTVHPDFKLDTDSIEVSYGDFSVGTDAEGRTIITWDISGKPYELHTLTFKENLKPEADGKYPAGLFDTNAGDALLTEGTTVVNQVETPQLPREASEGSLTISKNVTGNKGNRTKDFTFSIQLDDETFNGTLGGLTFENGIAALQLKHGEERTVSGLPDGMSVTVTETDNYAYSTSVNGMDGNVFEGVIAADATITAAFTNHRSGSSGGNGGGGGDTPGGKPSPGGPGDLPEPVPVEDSGSPHPEINRLPIMGIEGPGFETDMIPAVANTAVSAEVSEQVIPQLAAQYAQNQDLAAWLTVPGTGFGYPVMYTPGNWEYYLHHNFAKQADKVGIPFLGEGSVIGGDNTLIHGHNVNGTLQFGYIWNYQDPAFCMKHPTIDFKTIYDGNGTYEVMSIFFAPVYPAEAEGVFKWYQYVGQLNAQQFKYYVDNVKAYSLYDTGVTANYGDKLITLETCADDETNTRLVVVARKAAALQTAE